MAYQPRLTFVTFVLPILCSCHFLLSLSLIFSFITNLQYSFLHVLEPTEQEQLIKCKASMFIPAQIFINKPLNTYNYVNIPLLSNAINQNKISIKYENTCMLMGLLSTLQNVWYIKHFLKLNCLCKIHVKNIANYFNKGYTL